MAIVKVEQYIGDDGYRLDAWREGNLIKIDFEGIDGPELIDSWEVRCDDDDSLPDQLRRFADAIEKHLGKDSQ